MALRHIMNYKAGDILIEKSHMRAEIILQEKPKVRGL